MAFTVVGLVKNTKYRDLREEPTPIAFLDIAQESAPLPNARIYIHSRLATGSLISAVKRTLAEIDPALSVDFDVFETRIRAGFMREQLMATLSGFFGFLAVLLAVIGLYGVISYMVARRVNEIGIRIALGASRTNVVGLILREAGAVVAAGLGFGTMLALAVGKAAGSLLYGLKANDPLTFVWAIGGLAVVAAAASYVPARRAARLEPMRALREE
jgi:ABC-type antimicrobial peptide transport system permease subunit